jgi:putative hydrolase of the HAD superfamily
MSHPRSPEGRHAVVFDLGGVVIRWNHRPTFQRMAGALGLPPERFVQAMDREMLPLVRGQGTLEDFWGRVARKVGRNIPRSVRATWTRDFRTIAQPDPEVVGWIHELKRRGIQVACLSNTVLAHARILRRNGWVRPFSPTLFSSELGAEKPTRRAYDLARQRIGQPARNLLFLDDVPTNVSAARAAGWKAHRFVGASDARTWVEGQLSHDSS